MRNTIISEGPYLGPVTYELGVQETTAAIAAGDVTNGAGFTATVVAITSVDAAVAAASTLAGFNADRNHADLTQLDSSTRGVNTTLTQLSTLTSANSDRNHADLTQLGASTQSVDANLTQFSSRNNGDLTDVKNLINSSNSSLNSINTATLSILNQVNTSSLFQPNVPIANGTVVYFTGTSTSSVLLALSSFTFRTNSALSRAFMMLDQLYPVTYNGVAQNLSVILTPAQTFTNSAIGPLPFRTNATFSSAGSFQINIMFYVNA